MNNNEKIGSIIWGIVFIVAGVLFALNALDIANINIFFNGWWTLFIIVPSAIALFTERDKTGSIIGVVVGVLLLLSAQGIISFQMLWKLVIPAILVIIGIKIVINGLFGNKANEILTKTKDGGGEIKTAYATFSDTTLTATEKCLRGRN